MRPTVGQNLLGADERQRKRRLLARVRMGPLVGGDGGRRVRRVLEDVVLRIGLAVDDVLDLGRIAIIASQNRSSSSFGSLSVGSTISVPATGNDTVGAWKP